MQNRRPQPLKLRGLLATAWSRRRAAAKRDVPVDHQGWRWWCGGRRRYPRRRRYLRCLLHARWNTSSERINAVVCFTHAALQSDFATEDRPNRGAGAQNSRMDVTETCPSPSHTHYFGHQAFTGSTGPWAAIPPPRVFALITRPSPSLGYIRGQHGETESNGREHMVSKSTMGSLDLASLATLIWTIIGRSNDINIRLPQKPWRTWHRLSPRTEP